MAVQVLSYPFRVDDSRGGFSTIDDESDTYKAQQVAAFIRTRRSERSIFPSFGIDDPLFFTFDSGEFYDSFSDFYPSSVISINEISVSKSEGKIDDIVVSFE